MRALIKKFIPKTVFSLYHLLWAFGSAVWFGFPSRKLTVIGVTGTNGKSSVVWILARILEDGGIKTAASSSIEFQIGDRCFKNRYKMTMPGRGHLQKLMRDAVRAGCTHIVIEVTSEGIMQNRHRFIDFNYAVFLNLAPEHIERHGSYTAYRAAKGKLFEALGPDGVAIVNLADKESAWFLRHTKATNIIGFSLKNHYVATKLPKNGEKAVAEGIHSGPHGIRFTFDGQAFTSSLRGTTNIENILVAAALARMEGVSLERAATTAKNLNDIPGRLENIENKRAIRAVVDYAHTPSALERVYQTLRNDARRMICVLGAAGGGRDRWKRPELGALAGQFCDIVIVTDEDPYDEDPAAIRQEVLVGVERGHRAQGRDVADRKKAIGEAIEEAKPGDVVVVTGKGSEAWMMLAGGKKISWDDRAIVREKLQELGPNHVLKG